MATLDVKELYGELEDPQHFEPAREARARIEFFRRLAQRQNWYFYKVEIPYTQPFTDLYDLEDAAKQIPRRQEKPMWLVVFLTDPQKQTISRERISEGLTFIINQYRTAEREPARAEKYGRYLDDWFARMENSITTNAVSLERIAPWKRYLH